MSNKQKKVLFWVIVGLGLVLVGLGWYNLDRLTKEKSDDHTIEETGEEVEAEAREEVLGEEVAGEGVSEEVDTSDWLTKPSVKGGWVVYKNLKYGFEIEYPEEFKIFTDQPKREVSNDTSQQIINLSYINYSDGPLEYPVMDKNDLDIFISYYLNSEKFSLLSWFQDNISFESYTGKSGPRTIKHYESLDLDMPYDYTVVDIFSNDPIEGPPAVFRRVYIKNLESDKIFVIQGMVTQDSIQLDLFQEIVDTFQFIKN